MPPNACVVALMANSNRSTMSTLGPMASGECRCPQRSGKEVLLQRLRCNGQALNPTQQFLDSNNQRDRRSLRGSCPSAWGPRVMGRGRLPSRLRPTVDRLSPKHPADRSYVLGVWFRGGGAPAHRRRCGRPSPPPTAQAGLRRWGNAYNGQNTVSLNRTIPGKTGVGFEMRNSPVFGTICNAD